MFKKTNNIYTKILRVCPKCGSYNIHKSTDRNLSKCQACGARFSRKKIRQELEILELFSLEVSARKASIHLGLNYRTVKKIYDKTREKIMYFLDQNFQKLNQELELDESYFGGRRKGKRGRGAGNKKAVFGILERNNVVYTVVVDKVDKETLMHKIEQASVKGSVYYTDSFKSYNDLDKFGKHLVINHQETFVDKENKQNHTNGIEGFWSYAKERMLKYHGVKADNFESYMKEIEFRYNYRKVDIFEKILQIYYESFLH
jgi:transposase